MSNSSERILTSHAGSLPRPDSLLAAWRGKRAGNGADPSTFDATLRSAVSDLVQRQREIGLDIINDGEYGHAMGGTLDYAAWWTYVFERLGGLELRPAMEAMQLKRPREGDLHIGAGLPQRRDYKRFAEAYEDPSAGITLGDFATEFPVAIADVTYIGQEAVRRDVENLRAAVGDAGELHAVRQRLLRR